MWTEAEARQFGEQGYLRLGQVMTGPQLTALRQRLDDLTLGDRRNDRIWFQLEPAYCERMGLPSGYAYHGPSPHYRKLMYLDADPLFREYFTHPRFCALLRQLIGPEVTISRAFALLKPAHDGSPIRWHQDAGPGHPAPPGPFYTIWTALDDAAEANGALRVLPGTHRLGFVDRAGPDGRREIEAEVEARRGREVVLDVRAGEAILLDNYLLHSSGPNPTPHRRRAVTLCYKHAHTPMEDRPPDSHLGFTRVLPSGPDP